MQAAPFSTRESTLPQPGLQPSSLGLLVPAARLDPARRSPAHAMALSWVAGRQASPLQREFSPATRHPVFLLVTRMDVK